jgi:hypothetical protein
VLRSEEGPLEILEVCGGVRIVRGGGGSGRGLGGRGAWGLLPACNLGPYTKEIKLFVGEEGTAQVAIWILECYDKGGAVTFFVGGGFASPAWFLSDCEGSIGGVMGSEGTMALLWGPGTASFAYTCGDAVYEYFGPFDVGPCCDVIRCL